MNVHWLSLRSLCWLKRFEFGLPYWIKSVPAVILWAVFTDFESGLI